MNINELRDTAKQPSLITALAGCLTSTALLPIALVGLGAVVIYKLTRDQAGHNERREAIEGNGTGAKCLAHQPLVPPFIEPLEQPLPETVHTVCDASENYTDDHPTAPTPLQITAQIDTLTDVTAEDAKREIIRQAMSELGKRSAKARRERNKK